MSGVSCMISDNSNKPSHPGAQDEWHWGGGTCGCLAGECPLIQTDTPPLLGKGCNHSHR